MAQNTVGIVATKDDLDKLWGAIGLATSELASKIHKAKLQLDTLTPADLTALGYASGADGIDLIRSAAGELDAIATFIDANTGASHRIWGAGYS